VTISSPLEANHQGTWAIRAARVFDSQTLHSGSPLVLISGSTIVGLDTTRTCPSADLETTDLGDVTLLPGLIDSHVHLAFDPQVKSKQDILHEDLEVVMERMRRNAQAQLRSGVTSIRDLGDVQYLSLALRDRYSSTSQIGPEIVASGPPITPTRGHCWFLGGEADGVEGLRVAVGERVSRGADVIKIMATGGAITPGWRPHESQYAREELEAATRSAHEMGRPIVAHAHGPQGITDAVTAGVDGIEHGSFFTADGIDLVWETVEAMANAGTFVGATEAWLPEGPMLAPHLAERLNQRSENFYRMHRRGVRIVCCSDSGVGPRKPHGILPRGAIHFGSIGFSNSEALASVTSLAAQACGLEHRKGRIAPQYDADLLAVAGNPLHCLDSLLDVRAVFRNGQRVPLDGVSVSAWGLIHKLD
jgi:imidazolonepropionase-like amidohydrolase